MRKLLFLLMTATLLFTFSSCKQSGGSNSGQGLFALLGLDTGTYLEVDSTTPTRNATGVSLNQNIVVNFSAAIDVATADSTTFQIVPAVAGTFSVAGNTVTFNPDDNLGVTTVYTVTITTGLKSSGTEPLELKKDYVFAFTTGTTADETAPTVSSTTPTDDATDVAVNTSIVVNFSEPIVAESSDVLISPAVTINNFSITGSSIIIDIEGELDYDTIYEVTVGTGVVDAVGNSLASPYTFNFMTGAAPDETGPTISFSIPSNGATGVSIAGSISILFNEPILASSVTSSSFVVRQGTTVIDGTIDKSTAASTGAISFTPTANLEYNLPYMITLTTGITDLAGNPMASEAVISFTTEGTADITAPAIAFTDPAANATGVSRTKTIMIAFTEAIKASSVTSSTVEVRQGATVINGTIDTSSTALGAISFDPSADLALNTTYTVTLTTGICDLVNNHLSTDIVFSFTTEVTPDTTAPTLTSTNPTDGATIAPTDIYQTSPIAGSWIMMVFDDDIDNTTLSGITVEGDTEGAIAINLRMTLGNQVYIIINGQLANDHYTVTLPNSITDDAGYHYAGGSFDFTVDDGSDTTPPTISLRDPLNEEENVSLSKTITVLFSEAIAAGSVTSSTFVVTQGSDVISGTLDTSSSASGIITFTPSASYTEGLVYTVTLTTGITDLAGNPLESEDVFSFTTQVGTDEDPPALIGTSPADGTTIAPSDILYTAPPMPYAGYYILVQFDDDINNTTLSGITLVGDSAGAITINTGVSGTTVGIYMMIPLANDHYTVTLPSSITDDAGNPYAGSTFAFTVDGGSSDTTHPTIGFTVPEANASGVSVTKTIMIAFSEAINASSVTSSTFVLRQGTTVIDGTIDTSAAALGAISLDPTVNLALNTTYTVTCTTGITDLAGNPLEAEYVFSFTTEVTEDVTAPTLTSTNPANGDTIAPADIYQTSPIPGSWIMVTFDDDIDINTLSGITVEGDTEGAITINYNLAVGNVVYLIINGYLANDNYTVTLPNTITDDAGYNYAGSTFSFTVSE